MSVSIPRAWAPAAGLIAVLALAGPASAFPQPRYAATLPSPATRAPAAPMPERTLARAHGWSVYVVQRGDTLTGVGRRFGESIQSLADLNELDPKAPLRAGFEIKLPPGAADSGKDPYASGPSPFALGGASRLAASKPRPIRVSEPPVEASPRPDVPTPSRERQALAAPAAPPPASPSAPAASRAVTPSAEDAASPAAPIQAVPVDPVVAAAVAAGRGRFVWPVRGQILLSFGPLSQPGQRNDGVNIGADQGAPVEAAADGEVIYAGSDVKGYGNVVLIKHPGGWDTVYAHLDSIAVRMRDHVSQGQVIGAVGRTGDVDQPQLHFETRYSATPRDKHRPIDPLSVLPQ